MKINKTLEAAAFTGITTILIIGFIMYTNILQQVVDAVMNFHVINLPH